MADHGKKGDPDRERTHDAGGNKKQDNSCSGGKAGHQNIGHWAR